MLCVIFDEWLFNCSMYRWGITRYGCSIAQLQVFPGDPVVSGECCALDREQARSHNKPRSTVGTSLLAMAV